MDQSTDLEFSFAKLVAMGDSLGMRTLMATFFPCLVVCCFLASDSPLRAESEKKPLFNGKDLTGWKSVGSAVWRVVGEKIRGGQDGDPKRSGLLMTETTFKDFEIELDFKIDEHGKYNSGLYLRHERGKRQRRGYQVNIGRGAAEEYVGLYTDRWLDKGDEHDAYRKILEWNHLRVSARGNHIQVWLNGHQIVDHIDKNATPDLLAPGVIAIQTYGAEGHAGWVEFKNIFIREF